jgi:dienelactone hydrolase
MDAADLIIVSDIFGRTPELEELASELWGRYEQIHIIDPYEGHIINLGNEQEAYQYFQKHSSIEELAGTVRDQIADSNAVFDLVGFSVGASAIWYLSETEHFEKINTAVCFYGSRIRDMLDKTPRFNIQLVFPALEHHFDVARLASVLSEKTNVACTRTKFMHGFMNKKSENFDAVGYCDFLDRIK